MQYNTTSVTSSSHRLQDLRELIDKKDEQMKKYKKALKIYARRLKSTEGQSPQPPPLRRHHV